MDEIENEQMHTDRHRTGTRRAVVELLSIGTGSGTEWTINLVGIEARSGRRLSQWKNGCVYHAKMLNLRVDGTGKNEAETPSDTVSDFSVIFRQGCL